MRNLLLAIALCAGPSAVWAQANDFDCILQENAAGMIMEGRQGGISLRETMKIIEAIPSGRELAIWAYEIPRYNAPENQRRAIVDFKDEVYLACLTAG